MQEIAPSPNVTHLKRQKTSVSPGNFHVGNWCWEESLSTCFLHSLFGLIPKKQGYYLDSD